MSASPQHLACDYCGLPVRGTPPANDAKRYCCVGCRIADDITTGDPNDRLLGHMAFRLGLAVFFSMNVMVFTMALWSWDAYAISQNPRAAIFKDLLRLGCLLFATPVVIILGQPLVRSLVDQIRSRVLSADLLLIAGVVAAYTYSVLSLLTGGEHIYLEVVCMILLAVTFGRWLEANGKHRALKSLETLQNVLPDSARLVCGSDTRSISLDEVAVGQRIRVLPGEHIPLDGRIAAGQSFVDERMVTGESAARMVSTGKNVYGGATNLDGCLEIEVTSPLETGVIQRLIALVREAATHKSRVERLVDQFATAFSLLIVVIATSVFAWHLQQRGFQPALMASMSVVLIACPCALAVATPLALWAAIGQAAARGIIFRNSDDLLRLAKVDHACFDKTGTLTTDAPRLCDVVWTPGDAKLGAMLTRLLASQTHHPLASAALESVPASSTALPKLASCRTVPGCGVIASALFVDGHGGRPFKSQAVLGSHAFCLAQGLAESPVIAEALSGSSADGQSTMFVGWDGHIRGGFIFTEEVRDSTVAAIERLHELGLNAELLTGDRTARASHLGQQLQIEVSAELLPEAKLTRICALQSQDKTVAMVGDGLNDAPALGAADVGIAMGCGVEVSRDAADVCLMSSDLRLIPWAIHLARDARRTIRRNLAWAVVYNTVGIGIATTGRLNPIFAAVAMVLSSAFVIAESLRLAARSSVADAPTLAQATRANAPNKTSGAADTTAGSPIYAEARSA